jgi:hypothetical protein
VPALRAPGDLGFHGRNVAGGERLEGVEVNRFDVRLQVFARS